MPENELFISFKKRQHFWFDSGLVGLHLLCEKTEPVKDNRVTIGYDHRSIFVRGCAQDLKSVFEQAYDILIKDYYDVSTRKQIQENAGYYYDSTEKRMHRFPKRNAQGIVRLFYDVAVRASRKKEKWAELRKKNPEIYKTALEFLESQGLKRDHRTKEFLIDGPSQLRPELRIQLIEGKARGVCFFCGEPSSKLQYADQLVYPTITGESGVLSFNSQGSRKPPRVCWKCSLITKFVPVNGFYLLPEYQP